MVRNRKGFCYTDGHAGAGNVVEILILDFLELREITAEDYTSGELVLAEVAERVRRHPIAVVRWVAFTAAEQKLATVTVAKDTFAILKHVLTLNESLTELPTDYATRLDRYGHHFRHCFLAFLRRVDPADVIKITGGLDLPALECFTCGAKDGEKKLKRCAGCHAAWYCSSECQKQDYKSRKAVCKTSQAAESASSASTPPDDSPLASSLSDGASVLLNLTKSSGGNTVQLSSLRNLTAENVTRTTQAQGKPLKKIYGKNKFVVKVQRRQDIPAQGDMAIYDQKRTITITD
ncbi:hypothetical protein HDU93_006058 [Gonapodya sp. JEL0774]|nr:hypothetical protein HDU93_006058 [Gonapodya sp. JEL0774]